jgi:hypothetical protein
MKEEEKKIKATIRMAEFTPINRFLGCTFTYLNDKTGEIDPTGNIVLVSQEEKIVEMQEKFNHLHVKYNPMSRRRIIPVPVKSIRKEDELDSFQASRLDVDELKEYQSLVGSIGWITGSTRHDARYAYFLASRVISKPRQWDMYLAVWLMDYLVGTKETPLVLGGPVINPEVVADASFATLEERVSVIGHAVFTGPLSGAIYASVGSTKCAVNSIWEAELMACSGAVDTGVYTSKVCKELEYPLETASRTIWVDNQAEIDWINGSVSNKRSRHIDVRMYHSRHMHELGEVNVQYIQTEENMADILTKALPAPLFRKFAGWILGHRLLSGLSNVKGLFNTCETENVNV